MKKLFSILLATMMVFSMAACNPAAPPDPIVDPKVQDEEVAAFLYEVVGEIFIENEVLVFVEDKVAYVDIYQDGMEDDLNAVVRFGDYEPWNDVVALVDVCSADLHNQLLAQEQEYSVVLSICEIVDDETVKFISSKDGEPVFNMLVEVLESK